MLVGQSKIVRMVLNMLGGEIRNDIDNYVNDVCSRDFVVMKSIDDINSLFRDSNELFLSCLSQEELINLRSYTGYNFKNINAVLRGNWTYDVNGKLDQDRIVEYQKLSNSISNILSKYNMHSFNFVTFRGTTLKSFSSYGINTLKDLKNLEGNFLYEQGFISTSLLEDSCYFNKKLETLENYNIKIKYLIPSESSDGALINDYETSFSTNQNEFLLDKSSLSKVIDVVINEDSAILTVVLVPKMVYDKNKSMSR